MGCFSFIFGKRELPWQQSDLGDEAPGIETLKVYSYKELSNATKDFCLANKVGEGGFGSVYKGKLKNGIDVAIKVLSTESKQGAREFLTELSVVSNAVHDNLVKMYGCCVEGTHRMLVYNYLENNSLAKTLLGQNPNNIKFNWRTRANICIGVARGLAYLHEEAQTHIIHRDIKASNVLLDKDLNPKISDFGLAKLLPPSTTHVSTRVAGTIGYLAPEYAIRGQVTRKSDVYSFGVLLLEIVSGRSNTNLRLPYDEQFLLERAWALYERGKLSEIIDTSLSDDLDIEEALRFLKIVFLCTQDNPKLRPSMSAIVMMLTGKREVKLEKISKPALISDFMDLKVKSHDDVNTATTESSLMENSTSMTFTTVCERD